MPKNQQISISRRIIQANERLHFLSSQWYCGQITAEHYYLERQEIISFIDRVGKQMNKKSYEDL